jgi:hypothetical protein
MKNAYLLALALLLSVCPAYSQANFGEQFKIWVMKEAARDSRALAKADYEPRVAHLVVKIDELIIRDIKRADSIVYAVYNQIQKDEKIMAAMDSLEAALHRGRSSRLAYYQLLEAENYLYSATKLKGNLDSLGSKNYFYGTGLYYVGRETLLESYAGVGQQFADNFQLKYRNDYTVTAGVTFGDNGQPTGGRGTISQGSPGMFTTIGIAVGTAYGGWGIPIGAAVGGAIDTFLGRKKAKKEQKKQEKEFKKQMRLLEEGMSALPDQLVPVDTLLCYYQHYVRQSSISNAATYQRIDSTLGLESLRFKEIFSYNARRQQLSQQQLTADHIKLIEKNFKNVPALRNFYSNLEKINFIRDCNLMISRLTAEEYWLKTAVVDRFEWLQRSEAYQDDLRLASLIIQQFLMNESYLPHYTYLVQKKTALENMALSLPQPPRLTSTLLTFLKTSRSKAKGVMRTDASKLAREQVHLVIPHSLTAAVDRLESADIGICFGGGGYVLCSGMSSASYDGQFNNNGRSPVSDILGSSYDGGLRSFSATATRQIGAMRTNIQDRVRKLQADYNSLAQVMPGAQRSYTQQVSQVATSARRLESLSKADIRRFAQEFDSKMPVLRQRLDQYMNQPVRTGLANLQRDFKLTQRVNDQIKPADIPSSTFRIGNVDFGFQTAPGQQGVLLAWEREAAKQVNTLQAIDRRVTDERDPVFPNRRAFDAFKATLDQVDRVVAGVSSSDHYGFEDRQRITSHYLAQAIKMRYAASGQLPAGDLEPTDLPFLESGQQAQLNRLVLDFKQCNPDDDDCASAYGQAIYQLYQNNSLIGLSNAEGQSFTAANIHQLATGSSEWQPIGPASSASAVSQATLLAMSGNLVIATRADDMDIRAGVLLPALPKMGTAGLWKGLPVPEMFYLNEDKPAESFAQGSMQTRFSNPSEVTFYTNQRPQPFNGVDLTIQDKGVRPFAYSDPVVGDRATVPSLRFTVHSTKYGIAQSSEQTVPIAGDYVGRIVKQYGSNSRTVFENIYSHRDELFGDYPAAPSGLSVAETSKLRDLKMKAGRFEDRDQLMNTPNDLYYCQTSRCLYNSCINELGKADPLDRVKILDYYNQVQSALVKYHDDALDIGTALTPGINDARDWYELTTGKDLITGGLLTLWQRGLSGLGLIIGNGAFYRHIDNLPMVRQNALEIAKMGIPDLKMIKYGNLKYAYKSKGGIIYERWDGKRGNDRLSKIIEEHYTNRKDTYFEMDSPTGIPALLDEAWKIAQDTGLKHQRANGNNISYLVNMNRPIGNGKREYIFLVFDPSKGPGFIVTAYPKHGPSLPGQ